MNALGIIIIVVIGAICVFECISLVLAILKRRKLKKQKTEVEVNNVKQENSFDESSDESK